MEVARMGLKEAIESGALNIRFTHAFIFGVSGCVANSGEQHQSILAGSFGDRNRLNREGSPFSR